MTTPPSTLAGLIEALTSLPSLDPVERARACPVLDKAATVILARVRADAVAEGTSGEGALSKVEFGRRAGMQRRKLYELLDRRKED